MKTQNEYKIPNKKQVLLDPRGVLVKEIFYSENNKMEMEIEFYDNGDVRSISQYRDTKIEKFLGFDEFSKINQHRIYKNGNFKIRGIYKDGVLINIKTNTGIKDIFYNGLMSINLYTAETLKLKQSESIEAPRLRLEIK